MYGQEIGTEGMCCEPKVCGGQGAGKQLPRPLHSTDMDWVCSPVLPQSCTGRSTDRCVWTGVHRHTGQHLLSFP